MNIILITEFTAETGNGHLSRIKQILQSRRALQFDADLCVYTRDLEGLDHVESYFSDVAVRAYFNEVPKDPTSYSHFIFDTIHLSDRYFLDFPHNKKISISPLFDFNQEMDFVVTRGGANIAGGNVLSEVDFAIFRDLKVLRAAHSVPRLVYHIGGGSAKHRIFGNISKYFEAIQMNGVSQTVVFFEHEELPVDVEIARFDKFFFRENDIVVTTGGLSLYESAYSGLTTLNFFLSLEHMIISGIDLMGLENIVDFGLIDDPIVPSNFLDVLDTKNSAQISCKGVERLIEFLEEV